MAPRTAKKDRGEPPKPVVKNGFLGFYPIKALTLSALSVECCDLVIGQKDLPESVYLKEHPQLSVRQGKDSQAHDVSGRVFNGFSDAFYRGKLPQAFIAILDAGGINAFQNEFLDYLEKLFALGFFLPKNNPADAMVDPVDQLVPCFVVVSNGIFYASFFRKLTEGLENISHITEPMKRKILGKFTRGIVSPTSHQPYRKGQVVDLELPHSIKIAGGSEQTQKNLLYILSSHGLQASLENRVENPVERLELETALVRACDSILPALKREGQISSEEVKTYATAIQQTLLKLGRQIKAFEEKESLESLLSEASSLSSPLGPDGQGNVPMLLAGDSSIFGRLSKFAESMNWAEEKETFQTLKYKVVEQLKQR